MTKKTMNVMKGIGAVAAVGGTVAMITSMSKNMGSKRKIKKTAMKAAKTMENVIDGITSVMQ